MKVRDMMTRDVRVVSPNDTIRRAAALMDELNVGVLPVCDGERLVGMVTDRDITVRATSAGMAPDSTAVSSVMTDEPTVCYEDDAMIEVTRVMGDRQIRRLPVIDNQKRLVGIIALGDLATDAKDDAAVHTALDAISTPSQPDR